MSLRGATLQVGRFTSVHAPNMKSLRIVNAAHAHKNPALNAQSNWCLLNFAGFIMRGTVRHSVVTILKVTGSLMCGAAPIPSPWKRLYQSGIVVQS